MSDKDTFLQNKQDFLKAYTKTCLSMENVIDDLNNWLDHLVAEANYVMPPLEDPRLLGVWPDNEANHG